MNMNYYNGYVWDSRKGYESTSYTYRGGGYSYIHMNWGKGYGGWRTYDYWRAGIFSDQNYQYNKKIIIVKP